MFLTYVAGKLKHIFVIVHLTIVLLGEAEYKTVDGVKGKSNLIYNQSRLKNKTTSRIVMTTVVRKIYRNAIGLF